MKSTFFCLTVVLCWTMVTAQMSMESAISELHTTVEAFPGSSVPADDDIPQDNSNNETVTNVTTTGNVKEQQTQASGNIESASQSPKATSTTSAASSATLNGSSDSPTEVPEEEESATPSQFPFSATPSPAVSETTTASPCNKNCSDLAPDCYLRECNSDYTKVVCAKTCQTCALRSTCFNAYGDSRCNGLNFLCSIDPIWRVVCKKNCESCQPGCEDLSDSCRADQCTDDYRNVWCARTCKSCHLRQRCYNALGDEKCARLSTSGMCAKASYMSVVCKAACTGCEAETASSSTANVASADASATTSSAGSLGVK